MNEADARVEYAKWFVKNYYLQKRSLDYSYARKVRKCEGQGYIRYMMRIWPDTTWGAGFTSLYDELDYQPFCRAVSDSWGPEEKWCQVPWAQLDDSVHDDNEIVQRYRWYREYAKENDLLAWLQAEAEFKKITAEAWLRSYGVDIQSP